MGERQVGGKRRMASTRRQRNKRIKVPGGMKEREGGTQRECGPEENSLKKKARTESFEIRETRRKHEVIYRKKRSSQPAQGGECKNVIPWGLQK